MALLAALLTAVLPACAPSPYDTTSDSSSTSSSVQAEAEETADGDLGVEVCSALKAKLSSVPRPAPQSTATGTSYSWIGWKDYLAAQSSGYLAAAEGFASLEVAPEQSDALAGLVAATTAMAERLGDMLLAFTAEFPEADVVESGLVDGLFAEDYPRLNDSMMAIGASTEQLGFESCASDMGPDDGSASPPDGQPGVPPNFRDELVRIALEQDVTSMEADIPAEWLRAFPGMSPLENGVVATKVGEVSGAVHSALFPNGQVGFPIAVPTEAGTCDWAIIFATGAPASGEDPPTGAIDVIVGTDTSGMACSSDEVYWKYGTDFL